MTDVKPTRFEDLAVSELRRAAVEDFAVEVSEKDSKKFVLAALTEGGVTWADYVAQHPEVAPEIVEERAIDSPREGDVITNPSINENIADEPVQIRVAETPNYKPNDKLLIKMERDNPLFEVRGHRFTDKNPYALVTPQDADFILRNETGFRQALPSELQEFFG